ncbi:MAG: WcaF family extracellular polysaccharide biosynthesis acetyltransferase [Flavobacteriales bacterium]|nr:WcaF family extracellular polysaccharide biosynthesis acetyltransferase [Flavobacteriales bacterium]
MNAKTSLENYTTGDFKIGRGKIIQLLWYITNVLFLINPLNPISSLKVFLLKIFGAKMGKGVVVKPGVNIKYPWKLTVGNHVWIGENVWIDNLDEVKIGDNSVLSQGAMLLCGNHNFKKSSFDLITKPIVLEEGVWIGAKCTVTGGVVCKSHSVLAVNSVASINLDAYSIYRGNPAERIKSREIE